MRHNLVTMAGAMTGVPQLCCAAQPCHHDWCKRKCFSATREQLNIGLNQSTLITKGKVKNAKKTRLRYVDISDDNEEESKESDDEMSMSGDDRANASSAVRQQQHQR